MQIISKNKLFIVISSILVICFALFLAIWLNLSWRPDISQLPPDSGFYAYFAKAILHGQIPYRDLWDNKPPLGYYLNVAALLIFGQTPSGVWWSSIVWVMGCLILFYLVSKKLFGRITAGISSILLLITLMNPQIFQGGNLTEVYALAPQIGIIGITYLFFTDHRKTWFAFLAGVLTACAFMIKQTTIGLGCASVLIMMVSSINNWKIREVIKTGLGFSLGFSGLMALISLYWLWIGALGDLVSGVFSQGLSSLGGSVSLVRYYFKYALTDVILNFYIGKLFILAAIAGGFFLLEKLVQYWLKPVIKKRLLWIEWCLVVALFLFPVIASRVWSNRNIGIFWVISIITLGIFFGVKYYRLPIKPISQPVFSPIEWIWLVAITALPLEVLLVSLGGRFYGHYFVTLIPSVTLAIAYSVWRVVSARREAISSAANLIRTTVYVIFTIGILYWGATTFYQDIPPGEYTRDLAGIFSGHYQINELDQYIIQSTQPTDEVLVWHIHLGINFVTNRYSPSRFLYPLLLFIPPSAGNTKLEQYVNDLENHPPKLIVIQKVSSLALPFVNTPIDQLCKSNCTPVFGQALEIPQIRQQWLRFQQFFESHYAPDAEIYDWIIFRRLP